MNQPTSRRHFLKTTAAAAIAAPWINRYAGAAEGKVLRHAAVGCSGMAWSDMNSLARSDRFKLVAAVDVDTRNHKKVQDTFPGVRVYQDWREMLDKEKDNIDSINVTTPDHMHAPIALKAMDMGKHVYGQKPLAHKVGECRAMAKKAKETGLVTQMGTQLASGFQNRFTVEFIRKGAVGKIKEVHLWSNKQWGGPMSLPDHEDEVPEGLDWDLWCGVGPKAKYLNGQYHPGNWRKRRHFGTSTLGDMGCHIIHPVFMGLDLGSPISVSSNGKPPNDISWEPSGEAHYVFPGNDYTAGDTIEMHWTHGAVKPAIPEEVAKKLDKGLPGQGSVIIGEEGIIVAPHGGTPYGVDKKLDYPKFEPKEHYIDWINACLDGGDTLCNFEYAAKATETILLGNLARLFSGKKLEWDGEKMEFTNSPEASKLIHAEYREF